MIINTYIKHKIEVKIENKDEKLIIFTKETYNFYQRKLNLTILSRFEFIYN